MRATALAAGLVCGVLASGPAVGQSHATIEGVTKPQIAAIEASKAKRTVEEKKVSSGVLDKVRKARTGQVNKAAPHLMVEAPAGPGQRIHIQIATRTPTPGAELIEALKALGATDIDASANFPSVAAMVPASAVDALAARPDVALVHKAQKANKHAVVAIEGRLAHAADPVSVRDFNVTGQGSVVCVVSDSLDNAGGAFAQAVNLHALDPAKVHVLHRPQTPDKAEDGADTESTSGEGLAMLEIVQAVAPDAELWFATGNGGAIHMADNILALRDQAKCDIMVDDMSYPSESPFQDDAISIAVNRVSDQGVLYFSSARNAGNKKHNTSGAWEGMFVDGGPAGPQFGLPGGRIHVFQDNGGGSRITLNTVEQAGDDDRVDLFWSDPLGGSANGYDLFVVSPSGHVMGSSTTSHTGIQDPYQSVDSLRAHWSIVIVKEKDAAPRFLHLDTGQAVLRYSTTGSVRGHNASGAENAFTVAARGVGAPARTSPFEAAPDAAVEDFSSDGPRRVFFKPDGQPYTPGDFSATGGLVRMKPDITAADGVTTTLPVETPLNPFYGTSAAAPHAAAIAALMLSCKGGRPTPAKVRAAFKSSAISIEGEPGNVNAGYGIVMARAALQAACPQASLEPAPAGTRTPSPNSP